MKLLDIRTVFLLLGVLYIVLPITVFLLLKDNRHSAVKLWCAGGLLVGFGMVFLGLRPLLEERTSGFFIYTLGNALTVAGYTMRVQSLRIDIQKPIPNYLWIGSIFLFILLFEVARSDIGSTALRMVIAYFWIGINMFFLAGAARQYEQKFMASPMRFIWISYYLLSTTLLVRSLLLWMGLEDPTPFKNSIPNTLVMLLGLLTVIYSNLAYVGVMLVRAEKESAASAQRNAKLLTALNKQTKVIKDLMRVQAFSVVGTYGSTVVHEVLQPLTAMRFALENLKMHLLRLSQDKVTQDRIDAVDSSAARAISVIENLRNFIVEREVQVGPVSLNSIIREVLEITASRAAGMGVQITLNITDKITVLADAHQLQRVLFNIVNNALDAIERNPSNLTLKQILIDTKYVQQKQFVLIKVIDTGVGLQAKDQAEIFEWLSSSSSKGMGVGLALSRMLVESWHGHISAYNADPNIDGLTGAVFELKLKSA